MNKQFELLEFVFDSVYVDLQYDEISLAFSAVSLALCCVCSYILGCCGTLCGCGGCCDCDVCTVVSQIQSCLCVVVGLGFVSTSPTIMRNSVSHPVGPHCWLAQKTVIRSQLLGVGGFDSSTACGLCRFR